MPHTLSNQAINRAKANMDHIYAEPDPRAYFRELDRVDYAIPDRAKPVFRALIDHLAARRGAPIRTLDLGCSYGINAAILKHDLSMADLYARYTDPALDAASSDAVIAADRAYFDDLPESASAEMIGLDPAETAIAYAERSGLIEHGLSLNLEEESLSDAAATLVAPVDLVMSTGCVGYVGAKSFDRLLPAMTADRAPWLANFVLRMFPFDPIAETLADHGYVTEKLEGARFVQRCFMSDDEQAGVIGKLKAQGIDPTGIETEGDLIAEFYLSRPAADADRPIEALLSGR
jgi:hypothetical protein